MYRATVGSITVKFCWLVQLEVVSVRIACGRRGAAGQHSAASILDPTILKDGPSIRRSSMARGSKLQEGRPGYRSPAVIRCHQTKWFSEECFGVYADAPIRSDGDVAAHFAYSSLFAGAVRECSGFAGFTSEPVAMKPILQAVPR
jgi:hypothetical protein